MFIHQEDNQKFVDFICLLSRILNNWIIYKFFLKTSKLKIFLIQYSSKIYSYEDNEKSEYLIFRISFSGCENVFKYLSLKQSKMGN